MNFTVVNGFPGSFMNLYSQSIVSFTFNFVVFIQISPVVATFCLRPSADLQSRPQADNPNGGSIKNCSCDTGLNVDSLSGYTDLSFYNFDLKGSYSRYGNISMIGHHWRAF